MSRNKSKQTVDWDLNWGILAQNTPQECLMLWTQIKNRIEWIITEQLRERGEIPWTKIVLQHVWEEYLVNWRVIVAVCFEDRWTFIDRLTLKEVQIFQKWTKKQIRYFESKHRAWNKEFYEASFFWENNKKRVLFADTLEIAKIVIWKGKNKKEVGIKEIIGSQIINWKLVCNVVTIDGKNHLMIPKTMREYELQVTETWEKIVWVCSNTKEFYWKKVQRIYTENWELIWIDVKTFEKVEMKLEWTDIEIIDIHKAWKYPYEHIWDISLKKVEIRAWKVCITHLLIYVDENKRPLMYNWEYVTDIQFDKQKWEYSFTLNNYAKERYTFKSNNNQ